MSDSKINQVMASIKENIQNGSFAQHSRLPSLRKMSEQLGISKTTIVEAYDRLAALGIIEAKAGSGFYVKKANDPENVASRDPKSNELLNALSVTKMFLDVEDDHLKPGSGWLPKSWMPEDMIKKTIRGIMRDEDFDITAYSSAYGYEPLRQTILQQRFPFNHYQIENIGLTNSSTQSIDLICRYFLKANDVVMIDKPCYFNFHALLNAHQVKIVSVDYEKDGPNIERFKQLMDEHQPRLYITNASIHNPTGAQLSAQKCHQILNLIEQSDMLIVEDDIMADFCLKDCAKYINMADPERVLYLGSFSKTLSASIRCGYIIAHEKWMEPMMNLQIATNFGNHNFSSAVIHKMLIFGNYQRYIKQLNEKLDIARRYVIDQLNRLDLKPYNIPEHGLFIWVKLPNNISALKVTQAALEYKIMFTPSDAFYIHEQEDQYLRINIAQSQNRYIFDILEQLLLEQR